MFESSARSPQRIRSGRELKPDLDQLGISDSNISLWIHGVDVKQFIVGHRIAPSIHLFLSLIAFTACEQKEPAEEVGKKIDKAVQRTTSKVKETGKATKEKDEEAKKEAKKETQ